MNKEEALAKLFQYSTCNYKEQIWAPEAKELLEYWSGVEKKIKQLQQENKELHNKIDKLLNENQSLRTRIKTIKRLRKHQTQKKNKYKSIVTDLQKALTEKNNKIDKAIELLSHFSGCQICEHTQELAVKVEEILKDSDVDE